MTRVGNQLGGVPFNLTSDTTVLPGQIPRSTSGVGLSSIYTSPTFDLPTPPAFPGSTVQSISNTVTGQLKFDQIAALISQGISAFGKNPSQQISGLTVKTVQPAQVNYQPYGSGGLTPEQQAAILAQQQYQSGAGANAAKGVAGLFDGIAQSFGISSTTLFIGLGIGAYLLLREPPKRR